MNCVLPSCRQPNKEPDSNGSSHRKRSRRVFNNKKKKLGLTQWFVLILLCFGPVNLFMMHKFLMKDPNEIIVTADSMLSISMFTHTSSSGAIPEKTKKPPAPASKKMIQPPNEPKLLNPFRDIKLSVVENQPPPYVDDSVAVSKNTTFSSSGADTNSTFTEKKKNRPLCLDSSINRNCRYDIMGRYLEESVKFSIIHRHSDAIPASRRIPQNQGHNTTYISERRSIGPKDGTLTPLVEYNPTLLPNE